MRYFFIGLRIFTLVFIPAFVAYLGSTYSILDVWKTKGYLGVNFNIESTKQILLVIGVIITSAYLAITNEIKNHKNKTVVSQRSSLLNENKVATLLYLENMLDDNHVSAIKVRVYKQKLSLKYSRKRLYLTNVEGLSQPENIKRLSFVVIPELQGLVGKCYDKKEIMYEEDFSQVAENFKLDSYQRSKYMGTKFWLCAPIINHKEEVVAIISFECIHCIRIPQEIENSVGIAITNYCTNLYNNCSEIFK